MGASSRKATWYRRGRFGLGHTRETNFFLLLSSSSEFIASTEGLAAANPIQESALAGWREAQ